MNQVRNSFILCLFLMASNTGRTQGYDGYFGKRFFIDVCYSAHMPFVVNLTAKNHTQYFLKGTDSLVGGFKWFNSGGRINAGYMVSKYLSLSAEYGIEKSRVGLPSEAKLFNGNEEISVLHEALDVMTHSLILKGEFSGNNMRPIGISHEIGLGVSLSTAQNRNYGYTLGNADTIAYYDEHAMAVNPVDFNELKPVLNYVAMYGIKFRKPITKSLMFNGGCNYYLNLDSFLSRELSDDYNNAYTLKVEDAISRQRLLSILQANIGLTFLF